MKTLLFTLLAIFLFSCNASHDTENHVGDFKNYYDQYHPETSDKELYVHKDIVDSISVESKKLVIK